MVHANDFQGGKGLDIHVRSVIENFYSLLTAVAIKVGASVFEFNHEIVGKPKLFVDGLEISELPHRDENFEISTHQMPHEGRTVNIYTINLGQHTVVKLDVLDKWVFAYVKAAAVDVANSIGLSGSFPDGRMLGRNGTDLGADRNAYGSQWQVQDNEPKLFHSTPDGHPMAPHAICKLPSLDGHQYLRTQDAQLYRAAVEACQRQGLMPQDLSDCIFDVSATKMTELATAWWGKEKAEAETDA